MYKKNAIKISKPSAKHLKKQCLIFVTCERLALFCSCGNFFVTMKEEQK